MLKILPTRISFLYPVTSMKQLRYRVQGQPPKASYTHLTSDMETTQQKLLQELQRTGQLKKLFLKLQNQSQQNYSNKCSSFSKHQKKRRRKKKKRCTSTSNSSDNSSSSTESE
ncbi:hypothetical protein TTMV5_gp3 [Torque teno mini virus 5]|uniref:DUF755 domain-containing protein n=1 Tax=Torque teno mini virus 5 TaxID=687373 RepID=Q9DUB3_9VIRU|nr:hypothetical protein TTMV5_gp3 [Torque teno mini virus 5]BAB19324.1 unnamed protein product [Torque teno mini virus 5]